MELTLEQAIRDSFPTDYKGKRIMIELVDVQDTATLIQIYAHDNTYKWHRFLIKDNKAGNFDNFKSLEHRSVPLPSIGRIVIFTDHLGRKIPAIVTSVTGLDVTLTFFAPNQHAGYTTIPVPHKSLSVEKTHYWEWPEVIK
ncbi:hypothetical protein QQ054_10745 [Oscillatoria amoena NRMC-F 0135]|nr:hypothetical protein [Oscillatoria amoena NRMC-F 0135]